jgi:hypothetical protein
MLCSRWFSLENLAYTAALILPLLRQGGSELFREKVSEVIHEGQHVFRQPLLVPNLEPPRRRTHVYSDQRQRSADLAVVAFLELASLPIGILHE